MSKCKVRLTLIALIKNVILVVLLFILLGERQETFSGIRQNEVSIYIKIIKGSGEDYANNESYFR